MRTETAQQRTLFDEPSGSAPVVSNLQSPISNPSAPSIHDLHRLAIARKIPQDIAHDFVHDLAVANFKVESLKDLSDIQRIRLKRLIMAHAGPGHEDAKKRSAVSGQRSAAGVGPASSRSNGVGPASSRSRSGRRPTPGVTPMITTRQKDFINQLSSEVSWSRWIRDAFIQIVAGEHGAQAGGLDTLATASGARIVIGELKAFKSGANMRERMLQVYRLAEKLEQRERNG